MPAVSRYRSAVRGGLLLLVAVGLGFGVYLLIVVPPTDDSFYPRCQLHTLTGLHCPGCGTTRSLHALVHGHIAQALAYNALAFIVIPIVGFALVRSLWTWYRALPTPNGIRGNPVWPWLIAAILLTYGVLRNLPWYPFSLLAPHELS